MAKQRKLHDPEPTILSDAVEKMVNNRSIVTIEAKEAIKDMTLEPEILWPAGKVKSGREEGCC